MEQKYPDQKVLIFACRWCGLIGADGAGKRRFSLPPRFRVIPFECASFVEPDAIIRAFSYGVSGVAVLGCHLGGCRFNEANHAALKRLELLKIALDTIGIGSKRLFLGFGTAHEDHQFAESITSFFRDLESLPSLSPLIVKR